MLELRILADKTGDPGEDGRWPLAGVELVGDAPEEHGFSDAFVARASADGYLSFENPRVVSTQTTIPEREPATKPYSRNPVVTGDTLVLHLAGGELRYEVLAHPGRYPDGDGDVEVHEYVCRLAG